jgi:toxin FitB
VIILDTNVVSELMSPSASVAVETWASEQHSIEEFFLTTITVAEILYEIELLPTGKRRDRLASAAEAMFSEDFGGRVLTFDEEAARAFSKIAASRRTCGRPIAHFDAQIAGIALTRGATLATRNTGDFESCGIPLVNPWVE